MSVELYVVFIAKQQGCAPDEVLLTRGSPMEVAKLLWPLLEICCGVENVNSIRVIPYDVRFEPHVDLFLEQWESDPFAEAKLTGSGSVRVLFERIEQSLVVCAANEAAGERMFVPPSNLPTGLRQLSVALLMLHGMSLPFEPGTVRAR